MPYKKNYRKRNYRKRGAKKAPYRKRKAKYQKAVITRMKGSGFSDSMFVKLNYVDYIQLRPGTMYSQYVFRGNSLFDPDYTGTGHQPMYFDQYAAIYGRYRVAGCSIKVDSVNASGTSSLYFILFPSTDVATLTSISLALEQGRARAPRVIPAGNTGENGRIKTYCSTRKAVGLTKGQAMDDSLTATVGSTPSQVWYWNCFWESTDNSSNVVANVIVKLTYYVQFFDRMPSAQS